MGSPLDPEALSVALAFITQGVVYVADGQYSDAEFLAVQMAQSDPELVALVISSAFTMINRFVPREEGRSVGQVLVDFGNEVLSAAEFMTDVLDGIDDLPGDPQTDAFHG